MEHEKEYLRNYLATIKSGGSAEKYKRVSLSPLRYAGGKSNAVGLILRHLPALAHKRIVSPFFGGGSVEIALSSKLGYEVVGYDCFGLLVNFWQNVIGSPGALADELARLVPDKENFTSQQLRVVTITPNYLLLTLYIITYARSWKSSKL